MTLLSKGVKSGSEMIIQLCKSVTHSVELNLTFFSLNQRISSGNLAFDENENE
jgi:hypothetical protein